MSVYKYPTAREQIRDETNTFVELEGYSLEGEILLNIKNATFPARAYSHPEDGTKSLEATNTLKSILMEAVKIASSPVFVLPTVYTLLFNLESLVDRFNRLSFKIVGQYILRDWHKMKFAQELELLIFTFLVELKIPEHKAEQCAETLAHLIQSDDAYMLRVQDLITSVGSLEPKYIKEYIRLSIERDDHVVSKKFKLLGTLARIALIVPKLRNAWGKAIKTIDISNLMLDDVSTYWAGFKTGYKFQGLTMEEQQAQGKTKGWNYNILQTR